MSAVLSPVGPSPSRGAPAQYPPPPLHGWAKIWRYGLAILSYLVVALLYFASASSFQPTWLPHWWPVVDLTVGLIAILTIRFRRSHPMLLAVLLAVLHPWMPSVATVAAWAYMSLCTRRRWREVLVVGSLMVVLETASFITSDTTELLGSGASILTVLLVAVAGPLTMTIILTVLGFYVGARRDLITSLQDRAETAEREQELRVLQGQAAERQRIAREMHDVMAHRMSLVSMHAGVLAYRTDLDAEQTRQIAQVVQENAHAALEELRDVLGVLRASGPQSEDPEKPQPKLGEVADLVAEAQAAGARVEYEDHLENPELLPAAMGRHAYRIVQEALTNARKHAPNARISLVISGRPGDGLQIVVRNLVERRTTRVPGAGVGLTGMAERATIMGGTFAHRLTADGYFEVKAWLPW